MRVADGRPQKLDARDVASGRFIMDRMPDGPAGQVLTGQGLGVSPAYAPPPAAAIATGRARADTLIALSMPGIVPVAMTTYTLDVGYVGYEPRLVVTPITVDRLLVEVTSASVAGGRLRIGIYNADPDWQPTSLVLDAGEVPTDSLGVRTIVLATPLSLSPGRYLLARQVSASAGLRAIQGGGNLIGFNPGIGPNPFILELVVSRTYGPYPDPGVRWNAIPLGAAPLVNVVFMRISTP